MVTPCPRLLVAEDHEPLRQVLCERFEEEGFDIVAAHDGVDALALLLSGESFDVLVLDEEMPGLRGCRLLSLLRAVGTETPAILVSGSRTLTQDECRQLGVEHVLRKPVPFEELMEAVRHTLTHRPP